MFSIRSRFHIDFQLFIVVFLFFSSHYHTSEIFWDYTGSIIYLRTKICKKGILIKNVSSVHIKINMQTCFSWLQLLSTPKYDEGGFFWISQGRNQQEICSFYHVREVKCSKLSWVKRMSGLTRSFNLANPK
jgi:hypothetical protein